MHPNHLPASKYSRSAFFAGLGCQEIPPNQQLPVCFVTISNWFRVWNSQIASQAAAFVRSRRRRSTRKGTHRVKSITSIAFLALIHVVRWDRRFWTERNCRNSSKTRCRCLAPKEHTSSSSTCGRGPRRRLPSNGLLGPQEWSMTFELYLLYFRGRIASTHEDDTPIEVVSTKHLTTVVLQRDIFRTAPNSGCIFLSIMLN